MLSLFLIWLVTVVTGATAGIIVKRFVGPGKLSKATLDLFLKTSPLMLFLILFIMSGLEELVFRVGLIGLPVHFFGGLTFWFLFSTISFALVHISNFKGSNNRLSRVIPHLIIGSIFAYVFLTYGFLAAWGIHFFYNLFLVLLVKFSLHFVPGTREKYEAMAS